MQLQSILKSNFTDEEYLTHQRELHKTRCDKAIAWVKKDINNTELIDRKEKEAAYAMQNLFMIPGSRGVRTYVGTPPKWSVMHTDDEEGLWVLNRTHWFGLLSELYHLTGKNEYAEKVMSDLENWIDTCPLPPLPTENSTPDEINTIRRVFSGLNPWRSLEVGIRMFDSWNFAYDYLLHTDFMTPALHSKVAVSFYEHALVLREMSPRYWPKADHNHYIHEMLGLLLICCIFPDFDMSDSWREFAIRELGRCAKAQFTEDGGQVEGSPGYHNGCLGMFFSLAEVAKKFDLTLPDNILDVCRKATDYAIATIGPDGIIAPFGDTGYITIGPNLIRRYYGCFGELGPTAKLFDIHPHHDPDVIPEQEQAKAREYAQGAPAEDHLQRQIDQYFARTGWTRESSQFSFMCHSPVNNGHSQIDPMTFILYLKGDPIVVDPSYYTYRECEERKLFKSPEYHSCLTFDNKHPYEYVTRWSFTPQREGKIRKSYRLPGVFAADASHHGYDPDYHKRLCALVGDDVFLVCDDVANVSGTDVRIYFHMDDPTVKVEGRAAKSDRINVLLPEGMSAECVPANKSLNTDSLIPTSRIILTDTAHKSRQYLTVFTKRDDITEPEVERVEGGIRISYKQGGEEVAFLWSFTCSLQRL
ncbi:MAG: alginate lyase family protein [Clostridia bacterium]|nr:alginate lyase family protein [Clostridia bacterium]